MSRVPTTGAQDGGLGLRAKLWLFAIAGAAVTVAVVTPFLAPNTGGKYVMPGPLTHAHASLAQDCAHCHMTTASSIKTPLHGLIVSEGSLEESGKCVACHTFGDHVLSPHSDDPALIAAMTERAREEAIARGVSASDLEPFAGYDRIACAVCHHEHQGADASLITMTNRQCQTCHSAAFESFADGHPEFRNYPYAQPLNIAFNHASHLTRHFVGARRDHAPSSCESCHVPSVTGAEIGTLGFESMCASCHSAQIAGDGRAGAKGIDVLSLPAVDVMTLRERGFDIGEWPADSRFLETELTPFLELALLGDRRGSTSVAEIQEMNLLDLQGATDEQLEVVTDYLWSIKAFLFELTTDGHRAMRSRVEASLGRALTREESIGLLSQMPVDVVRTAQRQWLPRLIEEMSEERERRGPAAKSRAEAEAQQSASRPADDSGDELLDDDLLDDDLDLLAMDDDEDTDVDRRSTAPSVYQASPEDWVASGGWHRRDETYTLAYRPTGHADEFLKCWLDVSAARAEGPGRVAASHIFQSLADRDAPGMCTKCHTIDGDATDKRLNWISSIAPRATSAYTKFDHRPHVLMAGEQQCNSCHQLGGAALIPIDRSVSVPLPSKSAFAPIQRSSCVECHTPQAAGNSCTQCHSYHATPVRRSINITPLPGPVTSGEERE